MIAIAFNELHYLHNLDSHVENSNRVDTIISNIYKSIQNQKGDIKLFISKDLNYSKDIIDIVCKVHNYIDNLEFRCRNTKNWDFLDPDTYITKYSLEVVFSNLELLFKMVDWVIENSSYGFGYIRPPGHHAESKKAMGFCLVNNVAVLAKYLQLYHNPKRIMIVDFDAHHGNGTQEIFYEDDSVIYFSTHAYPFYPFTGSHTEKGSLKGFGYTFNFPVSIYADDKELINIYQEEFVKIYEQFQPDFLIVSAGYDIHSDDPITYMNCTIEGINKIKRILLDTVARKNIVFILEGGYNTNVLQEITNYDINGIR